MSGHGRDVARRLALRVFKDPTADAEKKQLARVADLLGRDAAEVKHGATCPTMCSQCQPDVHVRRVTLDGAAILLDGQPTGRVLDHERVITARRTRKR